MMRSAQELASTAWGLAKLRKPPPSEAWSADFLAAASKTILGEPSNNQQQQQRKNKTTQPWPRWPHGGNFASSGKGANAPPTSSVPSNAASPCTSGAHALSITLYSVALMKLRPDQGWLTACLRYTTEHFNGFTIQVQPGTRIKILTWNKQ